MLDMISCGRFKHDKKKKSEYGIRLRIQKREGESGGGRRSEEEIQRSETEAVGEMGCGNKRPFESQKGVVRNI